MRQALVCIILILHGIIAFSAEAPAPATTVKAFRDWKAEKVQGIQARVAQTRAQIEALNKAKATDAKAAKANSTEGLIKRYEVEANQMNWNLEVAKDLSVTDYVILYLANHPSKTRFLEAAGQLKPAEVAELLEAYIQSTGGGAVAPIIGNRPEGLPAEASLRPGTANLLLKQ